ncbi:hypothetical protein N7474_008740 [Penicillium riverlandense]|uniref:uncharacterized protein n=1 Tax=Penicillium riverlandense TaxID=1903569 RepID=UPI002548B478|nr:uncharacterized protein N7474_008740 [Penicillium riverlandense]KAJ5812439.1 hypothetical protein N7474_008740 [Penicillium riverlandense]
MKVYLIRHAECDHNVGQTAGDADHSGLTELGRTQAQLLARHFRDNDVRFTAVFSSDLDRATDTARIVCAQQLGTGPAMEPVQTGLLREQLLGTKVKTNSSTNRGAAAWDSSDGGSSQSSEESMSSMCARANAFLRDHILPRMADRTSATDAVVAVVAHGVILQVVWACLADLFDDRSFNMAPEMGGDGNYMHPVWSNTGVMELDIRPDGPPEEMVCRNPAQPIANPPWRLTQAVQPISPGGKNPPLKGWSITILSVDSMDHLQAVGEQELNPAKSGKLEMDARHEARQGSMDEFYRLTGTA